jgi:hypothetical protein
MSKFYKSIKHYNYKYEKQGNKPERRLWKKSPCAMAKRIVNTQAII